MVWWMLLALGGCATTHQVSVLDALPYQFEARPTTGVVQVMPVLGAPTSTEVSHQTYLGTALTWRQEQLRQERTAQLAQVPAAVAVALPGAMQRGCVEGLEFHAGALRGRDRDRLQQALQGRVGLGRVLAEVAAHQPADATLFVWVDGVLGEPVSARGFPGDVVRTSAGPVVVDHDREPYGVTARIGMALVHHDGEVAIRYTDTYDALLVHDHWAVGRDLADAVAEQLSGVWPSDPRLALAEPARL